MFLSDEALQTIEDALCVCYERATRKLWWLGMAFLGIISLGILLAIGCMQHPINNVAILVIYASVCIGWQIVSKHITALNRVIRPRQFTGVLVDIVKEIPKLTSLHRYIFDRLVQAVADEDWYEIHRNLAQAYECNMSDAMIVQVVTKAFSYRYR